MARKPLSKHQPLLPFGVATQENEPPSEPITTPQEGEHHDVQDDLPGTAGAAPANLRPAPPEPDAAADPEPAVQRAEGPSPGMDTGTPGNAARQRQPDSQRSDGAGLKRAGGSFVSRFRAGSPGFPRRGDGQPSSYAARVKPHQKLFSFEPPSDPAPLDSTHGTLIGPPDPASCSGTLPPSLAGTQTLPARADSSSSRESPMTGQDTEG